MVCVLRAAECTSLPCLHGGSAGGLATPALLCARAPCPANCRPPRRAACCAASWGAAMRRASCASTAARAAASAACARSTWSMMGSPRPVARSSPWSWWTHWATVWAASSTRGCGSRWGRRGLGPVRVTSAPAGGEGEAARAGWVAHAPGAHMPLGLTRPWVAPGSHTPLPSSGRMPAQSEAARTPAGSCRRGACPRPAGRAGWSFGQGLGSHAGGP